MIHLQTDSADLDSCGEASNEVGGCRYEYLGSFLQELQSCGEEAHAELGGWSVSSSIGPRAVGQTVSRIGIIPEALDRAGQHHPILQTTLGPYRNSSWGRVCRAQVVVACLRSALEEAGLSSALLRGSVGSGSPDASFRLGCGTGRGDTR
jgi:hypothetical protein